MLFLKKNLFKDKYTLLLVKCSIYFEDFLFLMWTFYQVFIEFVTIVHVYYVASVVSDSL